MAFYLASSNAFSGVSSQVRSIHHLPTIGLIAIVNPDILKSLPSLTYKEDTIDNSQESSQLQLLTKSLNDIPEIIRFSMSGCLGSILFFILERIIHSMLTNWDSWGFYRPSRYIFGFVSNETLSFLMAYFLHVIPQHWIHAVLVYGIQTISTRKKYIQSLMACYST
jgi:hypothetical protein